jgi:hypothetical protein
LAPITALRAVDPASRDQHLKFFPSRRLSQQSVERLNSSVASKEGKTTMMTFKEFYQRSSKGAKAPLRTWRRFKTHKEQHEILNRLKKLKAAKFRSGQ